ncbi:MAG: diguanylate cyclase [Phycisphaerales bacterium JB043]
MPEKGISNSRVTPRVLVVGGREENASVLSSALEERFGAANISRATTLEALERARVYEYEIVLCFDHIEDATALDVVRAIQQQCNTVPIVMLLPVEDAELLREALRAGVVDVIFRTDEYLETVAFEIKKNIEIESIRSENRRLHAALTSSLAELKRKNQELAEQTFKLEALATTDTLTGLANRRNLTQKLHTLFADSMRYGHDLSCLMLDLDGFKGINDSLGHATGDAVLVQVGKIIDEQIRASDVGARYGGDEFVILLPHTSAKTAAELAFRVRNTFQRRLRRIVPSNLHAGISIGVSSMRLSTPATPAEMLQHADSALYAAKAVTSGGVMLWTLEGHPRALRESPMSA